MKSILNKTLALAMIAAATASFTACSDDDDDSSVSSILTNSVVTAINTKYVDDVIIPTYSNLANATEELQELIDAFAESGSQSKLDAICEQWKEARKYWEYSEAFLFGPASDYSIDPHIDTWPFDQSAFDNMMASFKASGADDDAACAVVDDIVGRTETLTGFHALEYMIFSEGAAKTYSADLYDEEDIYFLQAVAEDLFLATCKLEASWAGEDALASSHADILEENEWEYTYNYGEEFVTAGQAGSRWKTPMLAMIQIVEGCSDIVGEVGDSKIGAAVTGEDENYIESPFSYNSITDFYDNIMSVVHALAGSCDLTSVSSVSDLTYAASSVLAYSVANHPTEAAAVIEKTVAALAAIKAMKAPFVLYYTDATAEAAMEACQELDDVLGDLAAALGEE